MPAQYSKPIRLLFWASLLISYIMAMLPQDVAPNIADLSDKTLHFLAFAVLMLLLMLSYRIIGWEGALWLLGYAIFIELSQACTPTRCADTLDVVADVIGMGIGLLFYTGYKRLEAFFADS